MLAEKGKKGMTRQDGRFLHKGQRSQQEFDHALDAWLLRASTLPAAPEPRLIQQNAPMHPKVPNWARRNWMCMKEHTWLALWQGFDGIVNHTLGIEGPQPSAFAVLWYPIFQVMPEVLCAAEEKAAQASHRYAACKHFIAADAWKSFMAAMEFEDPEDWRHSVMISKYEIYQKPRRLLNIWNYSGGLGSDIEEAHAFSAFLKKEL